ncbi:hypothetical protein NL676_021473 [Syzygium grande]|nr:hypothetical protein NL676_021473 [Syzygium grande]
MSNYYANRKDTQAPYSNKIEEENSRIQSSRLSLLADSRVAGVHGRFEPPGRHRIFLLLSDADLRLLPWSSFSLCCNIPVTDRLVNSRRRHATVLPDLSLPILFVGEEFERSIRG